MRVKQFKGLWGMLSVPRNKEEIIFKNQSYSATGK
jgi:hypothetical protein